MGFKMQMPKEMIVRMAANVICMLLAICGATYAAWLVKEAVNTHYVAAALLLLVPAGLAFLMAKIMWALKKKTKMIGLIVLPVITVLNILTSVLLLIDFGVPKSFIDAGWSIGLALCAVGSGICIAIAQIAGEINEKLKKLFIAGIACLGVIVLLLAIVPLSESGFANSLIGTFCTSLGVTGIAIVGYVAESILIKKKFMVYN